MSSVAEGSSANGVWGLTPSAVSWCFFLPPLLAQSRGDILILKKREMAQESKASVNHGTDVREEGRQVGLDGILRPPGNEPRNPNP